ncbi:WecB/TagA/CpsF family glycosyltransferase [Rhodococcus sp. SORGH_AS_0301]|uniref:WecB/TagA/CpsF family glycosyltransferase n=1 Tax=Rhodococcus sp. SORGH_AS_0301 TaxID=3041780 RepID=UPI0027D8D0B5|nr:WecB/TagA/CpsF family glycosyltransferase [Rhodococcus sp. SORGH_AS_0301]
MPFEVTSLTKATSTVMALARDQSAQPIRLANAYCVAAANSDDTYMEILRGPGMNFPDGSPVVWFMRRSKGVGQRPGRVRGPSLFAQCLDEGREHDVKHFFVGTTTSTLELLQSEAERRYPGLEITGTYAPKFAPVSNEMIQEIADEVNARESDIVWIAMGTPKQDFVAAALAPLVNKPCIGVGAAFDFIAGTSREAPLWVQNSSFEWLYRLAREPKRLWRRYLIGNLVFLKAAVSSNQSRRER